MKLWPNDKRVQLSLSFEVGKYLQFIILEIMVLPGYENMDIILFIILK